MMMSERTIIPTFAFWAFLTIITPTLILLSENSKAELHLNGNITETMKVRRMNGHTQNNNIIKTAPPPQTKLMVEEELAPAPAATVSLPLPTPSRSHSHHNHTLIRNNSNSTDDASKSKVQIQVQQTNVKYKST
ncbi:hypothetical protein P8452_23880 [Trifolium repens]|nr:hypothetical protein P8452_23880 [Trifolium repens]